jgi:hypothetical protein
MWNKKIMAWYPTKGHTPYSWLKDLATRTADLSTFKHTLALANSFGVTGPPWAKTINMPTPYSGSGCFVDSVSSEL